MLFNVSKLRDRVSPSPSSDILYPSEDNCVSFRTARSLSGATSSLSISEVSMRSRRARSSVNPIRNEDDLSIRTRTVKEPQWGAADESGGSSVSFVTTLYAFFMIVFLLIEETSLEAPPEKANDFRTSSVFSFYMYLIGIWFYIYVYLFVIHPGWFNRLLRWIPNANLRRKAEKYKIIGASNESEPVNSLYLRIGIVFFGTMGMVLFGMLLYLLFANKTHNVNIPASVIESILGIIFTFLQMLFMTVNYKVSISSSRNICRFGFMHNFALNVWTWHRFVIAKFNESIAEHAHRLEEREALIASLIETSLTPSDPIVHYADLAQAEAHSEEINASSKAGQEIITFLEHFGHLGIFLASCMIEYSVIGAAVMFVFWKRIDEPKKAKEPHKESRVDHSHSKGGLFAGVVVAIGGAICCGVYAALDNEKWMYRALVFGGFDVACYILSIIAVVFAVRSMRSMTSSSHHGEDVDDILLYIAFIGEVVWCSAEMTNFMSGRVENRIGVQILNVTLVRLVHVFAQTWFILSASRMHMTSSSSESSMRGRQFVTFLLIVNITMFFFGIYESMNDRFGFLDLLTSTQLYMKLYAAPITVFYRFHSSVCLAEIWHKSFARPAKTITRVNSLRVDSLPSSAPPLLTIVTID